MSHHVAWSCRYIMTVIENAWYYVAVLTLVRDMQRKGKSQPSY
jgi:hypothetical protein